MTNVYILLKNFDEEGWETYSISTTFEKACEDAKDHASYNGNGNCTKYCVEHWRLENSAYLGTTELDLEKI